MASLLSPTATTFHQDPKPIKFAASRDSKHISNGSLWPLTSPSRKNFLKCNAFLNDISDNLLNNSLLQYPALQQLEIATEEIPEFQKWGLLIFSGITWVYLTARPGVLIGAIDAYILAPLQLGLDTLSGRRSLKRTDFLVGDILGEGSFGIVYSGVVVPKDVTVDETFRRKGNRRGRLIDDERFKEKVILKKVTSFHLLSLSHIPFGFMYSVIFYRLRLELKGLQSVESLKSGLITGYQEQLQRLAQSFLEVL